jgi:Uma2 family endonuclease
MSTILTENLVLGPELAGTHLTAEEFDAVAQADRNFRYELIDGRLIVTPPPLEAERGGNENLGILLYLYQQQHPQGAALDDTLPEQTVITGSNRRRADRVIWAGLGRRPNPQTDLPTIVAEWVSEKKRDWRRDYVEKLQEYLALGIAEYWIFDRFRRTLTVYRSSPQAPQELVIREGEIYCTPLLPGFELPVARLLAVADRWSGKA